MQVSSRVLGAMFAFLVFALDVCAFPQGEEQPRRTIPAGEILKLVDSKRIVHEPIKQNHVRIEGPLNLQYVTFEDEVLLTDVEFASDVDFSFTTFERAATFSKARFLEDVRFEGAVARRKVNFTSAQFSGEANFFDIQVQEVADFSGCKFMGEALFHNADFGGDVYFNKDYDDVPVTFEKRATFSDSSIKGEAQFQNADFHDEANFQHLSVDAAAFFLDTHFTRVRFASAVFQGEAQFDGSRFERKAEGDNADFDNVRFEGLSTFEKAESFIPIHFIAADFQQPIKFDNAKFHQGVDFTTARSEASVSFNGTDFSGKTVFYGASLALVTFSDKLTERTQPQAFHGDIDFRNFTYTNITVAWRDLVEKIQPYDRESFVKLEKSVRSVGQDDMADEIYLKRRQIERSNISLPDDWPTWTSNVLFELVAGYGVRPLRLVVLSAVLLLLGTMMFSKPGTVGPKDPKDAEMLMNGQLKYWQAFPVALQYFLPGLDVPGGVNWTPIAKDTPIKLEVIKKTIVLNPAAWTTVLLRIPGLILVPLLLGITTGLLRTISP